MKQHQEAEYESRLAELAAAWFRRAEALDVLFQYAFTGVTAAVGPDGTLEAMDALVTQAIQASGAMEREDRWINLTVDRQPEQIHLLCASAGVCPAELPALAEQGAEISLHQDPDGYDLTVDWREEGAPC